MTDSDVTPAANRSSDAAPASPPPGFRVEHDTMGDVLVPQDAGEVATTRLVFIR